MMQYLGIIEQRTNEILQLYASTQAQAREGALDAQGNPLPTVTSILGQGKFAQPSASVQYSVWCLSVLSG